MLSKLSTFSGPLSNTFRIPGGFTLNGLILRYIVGDIDSYYGGTSVTDLQGNSNATLINGPTFSTNGYINFDGSNDYLITNTSLNSKLSPPNTSTVISYFLWVYPQDNGVIVTEQGTTILNTNWYDSQIEIVAGTFKFATWPYIINEPKISSSISTPLNKWYYVGIVYDGTALRAYINGNLAGSNTYVRQTPYNDGAAAGLYYALASGTGTNLGDGTYAKMKFGDFHVYNTALTQQQVLNNYNATKNSYIYTDDLLVWIDANDAESYSGSGATTIDLSGNGNNGNIVDATFSTINGIKTFDFDGNGDYILIGQPITTGSNYTICAWLKADSISGGRNIVSSADAPLFISNGTLYAGVGGSYLLVSSTSFPISVWRYVSVTFNDTTNTMKLYINGVLVDTNSSVTETYSAQNTYIGSHFSGGSPTSFLDGSIASVQIYSEELTNEQIKQNFSALTKVYRNIETFTDVGTTTWTVPFGVTTVEYLVVGGGGGGGNGYDSGGGGGAGGGMVLTGFINVSQGSTFDITVGQGGTGGADTRTNNNGTNGGNSVFGIIIALGGGYGAGSRTNNPGPAGVGAGLGGSAQSGSVSAPTGGNGGGGGNSGGGGGGAGSDGSDRINASTPGTGGSGIASSISGVSVTYGAGGNGGSANNGTINGTNGAVNTGKGGGAGSSNSSDSSSGGNGGSGIVIIRYY